MHSSSKKLGFWGLVALVFGLMVGVGIFNLPQNMAHTSSVGAVILAWTVTAAGMLTLVVAFKILADKYPQYNAGIYEYAQEGFGQFMGFNTAWGYWLCTAFSNVAYAVMLNDAFGAFFPCLLDHGWPTVAFGSLLIWVMFFIVTRGIQTANVINTTLAVVKVLVLLFIIAIFILHFNPSLLGTDLWGHATPRLGSIGQQVKGSMMVTLFCFFGIEGAVMMSARAKRSSDVGRAGFVGFIVAWALYLLVSVLCFGLMSQTQLSELQDPSAAYILKDTMGEWAYYFVIGAVIIALLGGWVAWTLVVAQVPYEAAKVRILPRVFLRTNRNSMPTFGLFASSIVMELFLLLVVTADNVYLAALHITGLMILPCYLFTALFLLKQASTLKVRLLACASTIFCLWMIYAGGLKPMLMTSIFYLCGVWFFIIARREDVNAAFKGTLEDLVTERRLFSPHDLAVLIGLIAASVASVLLLTTEGSPF